MIEQYKHYAQKNNNGTVTSFFSDAFRQPDSDSVLYCESQNRHIHKDVKNEHDVFLYKIDDSGNVVDRTDAEKEADLKEIKRQAKIHEINSAIAQSRKAGFEYKGKRISTSQNAILNWNALMGMINAGGDVIYPFYISTIDESGVAIQDQEELKQLYKDAVQPAAIAHSAIVSKRQELADADLSSWTIEEIKNFNYGL